MEAQVHRKTDIDTLVEPGDYMFAGRDGEVMLKAYYATFLDFALLKELATNANQPR